MQKKEEESSDDDTDDEGKIEKSKNVAKDVQGPNKSPTDEPQKVESNVKEKQKPKAK